MKLDEKIIKYLENELSTEERANFDKELSSSEIVREEFNKYLRVKNEVKLSKENNINKDYLDSIVPKFRSRVNNSKPISIQKNIGYAFGVLLVLISSFLIFNRVFDNNDASNSLQQFTESLDDQQKIELLESLNGDVEEYFQLAENTQVPIAELIENELNVNYEIAEVYDISYVELIDQLNPSDADLVYNEILNTNFKEVQL
jgi:hypothetical protein